MLLKGKLFGSRVEALRVSGTTDYSEIINYVSVELVHKQRYVVVNYLLNGHLTFFSAYFGTYIVKVAGLHDDHALVLSADTFEKFFKSDEEFQCSMCMEREAIHKNETRPTLCNQCVADTYGDN